MSVIGPPGDLSRPKGRLRIVVAPDGWQLWDDVGVYNGPYASEAEANLVGAKIAESRLISRKPKPTD